MISKDMDADIDVTSMTDDGILNPYKVSLSSDKNVDKEAYLSKLTESKLTQAMEEHMFDGESAEQEQNESFESGDGNSYGSRQSRKLRNPSLWQRPDVRRIVEDFINKDITSRGAANKISEILGRNVSHSTVLTYANRLLRGIKREVEEESVYQVQVEPDDSPAPVDEVGYDVHFELVKTSRGNDNGLAVYEDNSFVRVYRRTSTTGRSASYRCSTCDHLYEKFGQGERPTIKMRDNVIVTDPFPTHNQMCTPTSVDVFRRTQEDLEARQLNMCRRVLTNSRFKEMRWARSFDTVGYVVKTSNEEEEAINKCIESLLSRCRGSTEMEDEDKEAVLRDLIEGYKRGEVSSLTELAKLIKENLDIDVSSPTLCRYLKKQTDDKAQSPVEPDESDTVLIARPGLSKYLNETLITVPENEGFRQYSFMKRSSDGVRSYYRCLGCSRAKRLYGPDRQAYVKVEYGEIIDRPLHHRRCEPQSEESVLVQNLDRECRRSIRKGEKNPREAHAEGLDKMAEIEASFSGDENIHGTLQKLFPSWERVKAAYFRQRDLLKKAAIAAELEEGAYQTSVHGSEIGRYEEIEGNESFITPPGAAVELTPEMNALKNQLLFDVQQAIRREVTRAVTRTTIMMEQRFDAKIVQIFDDIFRTQNEEEIVEAGVVDEYALQEFPSTSSVSSYPPQKRRRLESIGGNERVNDTPFSIPACYLKRNKLFVKEIARKKNST
uniref:RYYR-CCHC domain-containing protein n=1 Tax=Onchocerca volvulus TaxID=6282 RepID=A0A8R1U1E7_ONCVO